VKIVVPDDFPIILAGTPAERQLRALGDLTVHGERGAHEEDELARRVGDADVVLTLRASSRFSERVIAACPSLRFISVWGSGTDNIDRAACESRNIAIANTPGVNANAVAEHTLALMLAVTRQIPAMDRKVRDGQWPRAMLVQLEGKTLGIIGFGAIGQRVAALALAFGMRVLVTTWRPHDGRVTSAGAVPVALDTLLRDADVVSLHLRLTPETSGILSRERFALMKPLAFLINTARGALVDRSALLEALRDGRLAGAGLDVFHEEPVPADDALLTLPNVVLTPHNAGTTREVVDLGLRRAVENVERFVAANGP
jgi:D-3-phosphoglycerate dehydrogenase / 2-oxoglutarate reductase